MDTQFWLERWDRQEIGFNQSVPHPLLQSFYPQILQGSAGVFVPLCGKSVDLNFIAAKADYTLGNELSDKAVKAFFAENNVIANVSEAEGLVRYKAESLDILQGDFFAITQKHVGQCRAIYDRAALIALPQAMRINYVNHLRLLFDHATMLLITMQYPQEQMSGPPFSVPQQEVEQFFEFASVELLTSNNILHNEPKFASRGLQELHECAYRIKWSK